MMEVVVTTGFITNEGTRKHYWYDYNLFAAVTVFPVPVFSQAGQTPLHFAANNRHDLIISDLLEADADVDIQDPDGRTALMLACLNGYAETTALLLEYDAATDVKDNEGLYSLFQFLNY